MKELKILTNIEIPEGYRPMEKESLINKDRMWRTVLCLNPEHETVKFETNDVGNILCPTCKKLMVTEVKSVLNFPLKDDLA